MIEIFRTNVRTQKEALFISECLKREFPECKANFDLEDCENILRFESKQQGPDPNAIISLVAGHGFQIEILPDELPACNEAGLGLPEKDSKEESD